MAKEHKRGSQGRDEKRGEDFVARRDETPELAEDMPISDESRQAEDLEGMEEGEEEDRERKMRKREIEQ